MNRTLVDMAAQLRPDLAFFVLFSDEIAPDTIGGVKARGRTITFNWFTDDHWRFFNFSRHWAPLFDWVATTDARALPRYKQMGYSNVIKTQWGCNHFTYQPAFAPDGRLEAAYDHDVTFVGQPHSDRRQVVEHLRRAGIDVQCWGYGWRNGRLDQEDLIRVFRKSRINLNLSKSSGGMTFKEVAKLLVNRRADGSLRPRSPTTWGDNVRSLLAKGREQIKGRNFEIPGAGGFLLTSPVEDLAMYFAPGREVEVYTGLDDFVDKIRYYLSHEREREAIREAGYARTLREHTYVHRFNDIFDSIFGGKPHPEQRLSVAP
jgi:spore maturation protein CgeB